MSFAGQQKDGAGSSVSSLRPFTDSVSIRSGLRRMRSKARESPLGKVSEGHAEMTDLYFEDFAVGQKYLGSSRYVVEAAGIKAFAAAYDPEPFHLDEAAAGRNLALRGLAASGWHTASITMRLLVESELQPAGGIVGLGVDEIRWPRPVRPGDELHVETEVLEVRASNSRPAQGIIKVRTRTFNQANEPVQVLVSNLLVERRAA